MQVGNGGGSPARPRRSMEGGTSHTAVNGSAANGFANGAASIAHAALAAANGQ